MAQFLPHIGMYALRERRQHVTQEDFEFAVAKVSCYFYYLFTILTLLLGTEKEPRRQHLCQQTFLVDYRFYISYLYCSSGFYCIHFIRFSL